MRKQKLIFLFTLLFVVSFTYYASSRSPFKWFLFNTKNALDEWEEKVFKNRVIYRVKTEQKEGYLSAKSEEACSGLVYRIRFDPKKHPMMSWKWKVIKFPDKSGGKDSRGGWLEKDDYAARVYVIFPSLIFTNIKCIEYVWDENLVVGTIMTSPYFKNIKLIVIESGRKNLNKWVFEERNIEEDYRRVFSRSPGRAGAIALMTDTDNTLSIAEALYTNIKVGYKNE